MTYDINSIPELVEEFGGDTKLAERLGITQGAVSNWKARNCIAHGWHMRLFADIRGRGKTVSPDVFGMSEDDAPELFSAPVQSETRAV